MTEKIIDQGNGKNNFNLTIDEIFLKTHDYLANLEGNIGKLLQKFHIKSDNYDGKIDDEKTITQIEKIYQEKILILKKELLDNKKTMNKQALVSQLIAMTMSAKGLEINEISKLGKEKLSGSELEKFEIEKNKIFQKDENLKNELENVSQKIDESFINGTEHKKELVKKEENLELKADNLIKRRLKNEIKQEEFESEFKFILDEGEKEGVSVKLTQNVNELFKKIEKSQIEKIGERSITSGILPIGMIATPGLRKLVPVLPAFIGFGIWARLVHGSTIDKIKAVWETILYIAPISGTFMASADLVESFNKWRKGDGELGDVIANLIGFFVSAGFDGMTLMAVASGIGIPAAVGLSAVKGAAMQSTKLGIKNVAKIIGKEAFKDLEKNYDSVFKVAKDFVVENSKIAGKVAISNPGKVIQQSLKETGEGLWSMMTFKGIRETKALSKINDATFGKTADALLPAKIKAFKELEKVGIVPKGATERITTAHIEQKALLNEVRPEDSDTMMKENELKQIETTKNRKSLDLLLQKINTTAKDGSNNIFEESLNTLIVKDEFIGKSINVLQEFKDLLKKDFEINETKNKVKSGLNRIFETDFKIENSEMYNKDELSKLLMKNKDNMSKSLYKFLEDFIKEYDNIDIKYKIALIDNKLYGTILSDENFYRAIADMEGIKLDEGQKLSKKYLVEKGLLKPNDTGYINDSRKIISNLEELLKNSKDMDHNKKITLVSKYLDILKQSDENGFSKSRYLSVKGENEMSLGDNSLYTHKIIELLKNNDFKDIRGHIIDQVDKNNFKSEEFEKIIYENNIIVEKTIGEILNKKHKTSYDDIVKLKQEGKINEQTYASLSEKLKELEKIKNNNSDKTKALKDFVEKLEKIGFGKKENTNLENIFKEGIEEGKVIDFREYKKNLVKNLIENKDKLDKIELRNELKKLMQNSENGIGVKENIELLKLLEKVGIINPRAEEKFDYIEAIKESGVDELRQDTSYIKEYVEKINKDIEKEHESGKTLFGKGKYKIGEEILGNKKLIFSKNLKTEDHYMIKLIIDDIGKGRKGLEAKDENSLKRFESRLESGEYIKIGNEYFATKMNPNRYFLGQFLKAENTKRAESYMELIHDKSDFGGKTIKEIFNDPSLSTEKKILLSYHEDIKYDKEVISLILKERENPKYAKEIVYVLQKRKDSNILNSGDEIKVFERGILENLITKEFLETKEGKKLTDEEFNNKKNIIIDAILLSKNSKIQELIQSVRLGEESIENTKKITDEIIISIKESKDISSEDKIFAKYIYENKDIFARLVGEKSKLLDDIRNLNNSDTIKSIITLVRGNNAISEEERIFRDDFLKIYDNKEVIKNLENGDGKTAGTKDIEILQGIETSKSLVRGAMSEENLKETKNSVVETPIKLDSDMKEKFSFMGFGNVSTPKKLVFTLVTLGIMSQTEAEAAESKIVDKWKSSPEYKKFIDMGGENSEAAKKLRDETVLKLTQEVLNIFEKEIEEKFQKNMESKIEALPPGLKVLLAEINLKIKADLDGTRSRKDISSLNIFLYQYVESILYSKGIAEKKIIDITKRYPELEGKKAANFLLEIGKLYDEIAKKDENIANTEKEIAKSKEEIAKSKEEIAKSKEEIAKSKEEIAKSKEEIKKRNEIIEKLKKI